MNLTHALPQDELLLARLTASKLAKIMHGLLSVGSASLSMESPTDFLTGREKTPFGFLEVLRCIGVYAEHIDVVQLLRQQVDQLSDLTRQFHTLFMELARWRTMSIQDVRALVDRLGDTYSQFCQLLGVFCSQLGMDSDYSDQAQQDRNYLEAVIQTVLSNESDTRHGSIVST
jgi:hypothetical protein